MKSLAVFVLIVAAAAAFGAMFAPGQWFASLQRPPFAPPDWLFAPVWTVLYLCIAVAAWLVWRAGGKVAAALVLWALQLALNALWSLLFFGFERPDLALLDIGVLLAIVIATTVAFYRLRRAAGFLFLPYAAWVAFAGYLNAGFWLLNR